MTSIKKYELEDDAYNEVHLEVNHSILTEDIANEINEFWSNAEERLDECDGDVIKAVLRLAFVTVIGLMHAKGWDQINAKAAEDFTKELHLEEGWRESGIKVTYVALQEIIFNTISVRCLS